MSGVELINYIKDLNIILQRDYKNAKTQTFYNYRAMTWRDEKRIEIYQSLDGHCYVKYILIINA